MQIVYGAIDTAVSIELKTGECYNGYVQQADYFMNFKLKDVTITSPDASSFYHVDQCFVRGNTVKYVRVCEDAVNKAAAQKSSVKRGNFRGKNKNFRKK